jgi:hypothetical protein
MLARLRFMWNCPAVKVSDAFLRVSRISRHVSISPFDSERVFCSVREVRQILGCCGVLGSDDCDFEVRTVWNEHEEKVQVTPVVMQQRGLS